MPQRRPPNRRDFPAGGPNRPRPPRRDLEREPPSEPRGKDLERLQKVLARAGIASRRACEELIAQGRITVNGQVIREPGTRIDPQRSKVEVDGQRIQVERPVYFAVNKPKGYVSTNHDPGGRPRVIDLLPEVPQRVYTVGRLDEMSVGLLLLTNDGELAHKLAHPRFGVEKVYRAIVAGKPTREVLDKMIEGIWLAEGKARAKHVRVVGHKGEATILEMVLAEGKNREVRRMMAKLGHKIMSLTRVAVGPITLRGLKPGEHRRLSAHEVELLRRVAAGIPVAAGRRGHPDRHAERRPPGVPRRAPAVGPTGGPPPRGPQGRRKPPGPIGRPIGPPPGPAARRPARPMPARPTPAAGPVPPAQGPRRPPRRPVGPIPPPSRPIRETRREGPPRKIIGMNLPPEGLAPGGIRPRRVRPKRRPPAGPDSTGPRAPRLKRPRRPRPGDETENR
jgi:23S rRNA pseudouridine2605 synthase